MLQEFWHQRERVAIVEELVSLAEEGRIDLVVTRRIHDDIPNPPLANQISRLSELNVNVTEAVFRLDHSVLDGPDMLGSDIATNAFDSILCSLARQGQTAPDWRDWDHVHSHYLLKRDNFLTWEKGILRVASQLKAKLDISILKPEEFIEQNRLNL